jgi:hypothetical protein
MESQWPVVWVNLGLTTMASSFHPPPLSTAHTNTHTQISSHANIFLFFILIILMCVIMSIILHLQTRISFIMLSLSLCFLPSFFAVEMERFRAMQACMCVCVAKNLHLWFKKIICRMLDEHTKRDERGSNAWGYWSNEKSDIGKGHHCAWCAYKASENSSMLIHFIISNYTNTNSSRERERVLSVVKL